jgi:subtilase family protein
MAVKKSSFEARNFYLNEQHELTHEEKSGGGRLPLYVNINWARKGATLSKSLHSVQRKAGKSIDPLATSRFFMIARAPANVEKSSSDKRKAPKGTFTEEINYGGDDSRVLGRLGLDLVQVHSNGTALVHAKSERVEQLIQNSSLLERAGAREQARWAKIEEFDLPGWQFRIDADWLHSLPAEHAVETLVELQPLLNRVEADVVLRSIAERLSKRVGEVFRSAGVDFSGRQWFRGDLTPKSLRNIAENFQSVQALHPPLLSLFSASPKTSGARRGHASAGEREVIDIQGLPCVAVVDTGVPADHVLLSQYRRGQYIDPESYGSAVGAHGSLVASRSVFGDLDAMPINPPLADCRFYDALVATNVQEIDDKNIARALGAVIGTAPDVRIFNFSFDGPPIDTLDEIARAQRLALVQDLDNFIFANDVLVIIAAGNSPPGVAPAIPYPGHADDPNWGLGHWSRSFNALTCGSFVGYPDAGGIVTSVGWPSPFTRVGPGLCGSPKPDFAERGGNATPQYSLVPGLGVWGCNENGQWEDHSGTSFAAPVLAREAAKTLQLLQRVCEQGARPFAATAKAYLALTARRPDVAKPVEELASRTLGRGRASAERLVRPLGSAAVLIWQGLIENAQDIVRVQLPVPQDWLNDAEQPMLRIAAAWDAPVNSAAPDVWASRAVRLHLRPHPEARALRPSGPYHTSYPLVERSYNLNRIPKGEEVDGDMWLLDFSYEQLAEYYPTIDFSPQQRVAFAAELFDAAEKPTSPQQYLQSLPISQSMHRLSVPAARSRNAVILRTRI